MTTARRCIIEYGPAIWLTIMAVSIGSWETGRTTEAAAFYCIVLAASLVVHWRHQLRNWKHGKYAG